MSSALKSLAAPAFVEAASISFPMDGEQMTVTAASVAQITIVMGYAGELLQVWTTMTPDRRKRFMAGEPTVEDLDVALALLEERRTVAVDVVAALVGKPIDWVGALLPDRFAYLFAAAVAVNADFFSRAGDVFSAAGQLLANARPAQPKAVASPGPISSTP